MFVETAPNVLIWMPEDFAPVAPYGVINNDNKKGRRGSSRKQNRNMDLQLHQPGTKSLQLFIFKKHGAMEIAEKSGGGDDSSIPGDIASAPPYA